MQAMRLENSSATQGTPALLTRPRNFGALPVLDMKSSVRDDTYSEELPALMTAMTMIALMTDAAGATPASSSEMVSGDAAVLEPGAKRRLSL